MAAESCSNSSKAAEVMPVPSAEEKMEEKFEKPEDVAEEPKKKRRRTLHGGFGAVVVDVTRMAAFSLAGHVFGGNATAASLGFVTACAKALL